MDHQATMQECASRARAIRDAAEQRPDKLLTPDEMKELDQLFARFSMAEMQAGAEGAPGTGRRQTEPDTPGGGPMADFTPSGGHRPTSTAKFVDRDGRELPVLGQAQKLGDLEPYRGAPLSLAKAMVGWLSGDWRQAPHEREYMAQMGEGTGAAGQFLVPRPLSNQIIDLARSKSVLMAAGASTIPMTSQTLDVAKVVGDPTAYWTPEHAPITESQATLDRVTFTAQKVACLVRTSIELLEDAPNADSLLRNLIATALAQEIDRIGLSGSGSGEPEGVLNNGSVSLLDYNKSVNGYEAFLDAIAVVENANHMARAIIMSPTVRRWLGGLVDGQQQPMQAPAMFNELARHTTTKMPVGSPDSATVALGDFSEVTYGMRAGVALEVSNSGGWVETDSPTVSGDSFQRYQLRIRAVARLDVQVFRPEALVVLSGLLPPGGSP